MDPENVPSTSKRAKYLKRASDKLNACKQYPVAFDEFRKFTNVEEYVINEMERSGPDIWRINYSIRHEYYPIVFKKFYESKSSREKMLRRGLTIKPIPKFLKEKLLRMPGEDTSSAHKSKEKPDKADIKVRFAPTKHGKSSATTTSPAYKISSGKSKTFTKTSLKHIPKTKASSKPKASLGIDVRDSPSDSQKITNFFSALKLVRNLENNIEEKPRKRKPETRETSPAVKRLKDGGTKGSVHVDKVPLGVVNRVPMGPKSRRKTVDGRMESRGKHKNDENRRRARKSSVENSISDDSDIHSNVDLRETQNQRAASLTNTPLTLEKPLPKRNRTEEVHKPPPSPRKFNTPKKSSQTNSEVEQILSSSDAEMALLCLSGAVKKTMVQVSCEIQDWLSKGNPSEGDSDDESVPSFFEDEFTAIDKLRAIQKHPNDVRNYVRYMLNAEIQRRRIANITPEKGGHVSKSKVVAAFREMTFDEYKVLINAEKLYTQGQTERRTPQEITSDLRAQHEAIISGKRPWPMDQHVRLSTLSDYLLSKGLSDKQDLKCIPPRLLSFEEILEHTNLKEWTSLSRSKPPASYKQLLSLCREAYIKCCAEGVWADGLHFTDSNSQQEEFSESLNMTFANVEGGATEPAEQPTSNKIEATSEKKQDPSQDVQLSGNVSIEETQQDSLNNAEPNSVSIGDDIEKMMDEMFADSQPELPQLKETPAVSVAEQQATVSLEAPASERLPDSQPMLGYIPPSPALFQSSGESDQRTQLIESEQIETRPPEAVFVACERSMTFNTEENNMTAMSVDHDNHDPFASQNPEENPVEATAEDSAVLDAVVKKEPQSANNTQNSYNPFDDSVQILDIPPSEPITIEDEETAPELLNLLLMRPLPNNSTFVPPTSPPTQSSACMDTFVHAQRMPSDLSSTQSQLNPSQVNQDSPQELSPEGGQENASDALMSPSRVKREAEADPEPLDIDLIISTLKTEESGSMCEQSLPGRRSLQSPVSLNDSLENYKGTDVDLNDEHSYSAQAHGAGPQPDKGAPMMDSICVFIPAQRISSELESTQNTVTIISVQDSTVEVSKADGMTDKHEEPVPLVEGKSEIQAILESICAETPPNKGVSKNLTPSLDGTTVLCASLNESATIEPERHEDTTVDPPMTIQGALVERVESDLNTTEEQQQPRIAEDQEGTLSDAPLSAAQASMHSVDDIVAEKSEMTRKDLNDNLPNAPAVVLDQEVDVPSDMPELGLQMEQVYIDADNDAYIGENSGVTLHQNELFVGCNLEVNTNMSQAEIPAQVSEIDNDIAKDLQSVADARESNEKGTKSATQAVPITDENPMNTLEFSAVLDAVAASSQKGEEGMSYEEAVQKESNAPIERNLCSNVDSNLPELDSHAEESRPPTPEAVAVADSQSTPDRIPPASITEASALVLAAEALKPNTKKTFVLPALLPIAAFKSDKIEEFIENNECIDEPEIGDNNNDLVEVPILVSRRFLKLLPFDIVTPQQIRQTTKESTIYALKSKLEFCLKELRVPEAKAGKTEAVSNLKPIENASQQKNDPTANPECMPKLRVALKKMGTKKKLPTENEITGEASALRPNAKQLKPTRTVEQSTNSRKKRMSPRMTVARKPSALDFVPQKTHAFRSLTIGVAKKGPATATRRKSQADEKALAQQQAKTEESNYNIEDVSQAIASSTASQMLGTDCTYFESSQLLRNIDGCGQPAAVKDPPEEALQPPVKPKT